MKGTFSMRCSLFAVALLLVHGVAVEAQGPTFVLARRPPRKSSGRQTPRSDRTARDSRRGEARLE